MTWPMIQCTAGKYNLGNTVHMCAERRLMDLLKHESAKKGIAPSKFSWWVHRKVGKLIITRDRGDGCMGTSIPCILCRKLLEKKMIQWRAHIGNVWVDSQRDAGSLPPSKLTQKQKKTFTH
jgi:hypothetical protein